MVSVGARKNLWFFFKKETDNDKQNILSLTHGKQQPMIIP